MNTGAAPEIALFGEENLYIELRCAEVSSWEVKRFNASVTSPCVL